MKKIAYSYPLAGNDVVHLLEEDHRLPSGGEFTRENSWVWEVRQNHSKGKFGYGKANFRIFRDKIALVNAAQSYAWVMVFTEEFKALRKRIQERIESADDKVVSELVSFSGLAEVVLGHSSWSYNDQDEYTNRYIIRFEAGIPVELIYSDQETFEYWSGDMANYGISPVSESKEFSYSYEDWDKLAGNCELRVVSKTRQNGEYEEHLYKLRGKFIPYRAQVPLCALIAEFVK